MSKIVPIAALTQKTDRFACQPYRATITAGACQKRRALAKEWHAKYKETGKVRFGIGPFDVFACRECPDGEDVERVLNGEPVKRVPKTKLTNPSPDRDQVRWEQTLATVESLEFSAQVNLASGLATALEILRDHASVKTLGNYVRRDLERVREILARVQVLATEPTELRYERPGDVALATYVFALATNLPHYLMHAAPHVRASDRLFWAKKLLDHFSPPNKEAPP